MKIGDVVKFNHKTPLIKRNALIAMTRIEMLPNKELKICFSDKVTMGIKFEPNCFIARIFIFDSNRQGDPIGVLTNAPGRYVYSEKTDKARIKERIRIVSDALGKMIHDSDLTRIAANLDTIHSNFQSSAN